MFERALEIQKLRKDLRLSQSEFGNLFGIHSMTVSKWERDVLRPNPYQFAVMEEFRKASKTDSVAETLSAVLIGAGVAAALYLLLKHSRG